MEENNDKPETDSISLKNIPEDKLLNQATLRDLILFKEDILKEMRQYASKIKISLSDKFNKFVEETNQKLPDTLTDNGGLFMKNIRFIEEKNKILSSISEKENNLNEKIMVNDLHINNCQKELNDAVFKYDRAILDNLLIPGLVGKGCKFLNFRDYMSDIQGQINNAFSKLDYNGDNIFKNKKSFEEQINQANTKIKNLEYESKQFTFEKTLVLENKMKQEMETQNKNIIELTEEFYKKNVELKNQIDSLKKTEKLITEENRRINFHTLNEFDKMQKGFNYMKKTIIDLGKLLILSDKRTNKNKNFAANKHLIIEQFNNMILDLMKDAKKERTISKTKETQNPKVQPKKAVSVIKQYIEGKIQADDANYGEKEKKDRKKNSHNKDLENEEIYKRNSLKRQSHIITNKIEEINSARLNNNNKIGNSFEKYKKFSRQASVEFKDVNKVSSLGSNNDENDSKKNINNNILGEVNKSRQFGIIKEEKNNISKSDEYSLFSDLENDFKNLQLNEQSNIFNIKGYENKKYNEEINQLNMENSFKKFNKHKLFFRAATTTFDIIKPKKSVNINPEQESFKLLLKAQENLKKKNLEKQQIIKKDSGLSEFVDKKISSKNINYNTQDKFIDKKQSNKTESLSSKITNSFINQDNQKTDNKKSDLINIKNNENDNGFQNHKTNKNDRNNRTLEKIEFKNEKSIKYSEENQNNIEINLGNKNDLETEDEKKVDENKKRILEKINIYPKDNSLLNYKLKDNLDNIIIAPKSNKNKNKINLYNSNNYSKTNYTYKMMPSKNKMKNLSPENNNLKQVKFESTKDNFKREINLSANIKNNHHKIIYKYTKQDNKRKSPILNLKTLTNNSNNWKESQLKYNNNFRIQRNYNAFNEDIFVNKDEIKKMNYYRDKDIIDKPLLANQINFRVQNSKGTIENKIIELEYFTKKKFDELVREIKNFIPIHFNAYVKE